MKAVPRVLRSAAALTLAVLCSGCLSLSGEFGTRISQDALLRVEDGKTTREEITSWFGPPSAFYNPTVLDLIVGNYGGEDIQAPLLNDVFSYRYIENRTSVFFIPLLFARLDARGTAETLVVFFDENGRVRYHAFRRDEP